MEMPYNHFPTEEPTMKFYIASKLKNFEQVRHLADRLKSAGWALTHDWTVEGSLKADGVETLREIAEAERNGVAEADLLIVLTPQGGGTHTEFGMAIALDKRIYLYHSDDTYFKDDANTSPFYWLPQVSRFVGGIDDFADMLISCKHKYQQ
jgi:nucleoside 2-deoxyribosyltransferase